MSEVVISGTNSELAPVRIDCGKQHPEAPSNGPAVCPHMDRQKPFALVDTFR